MPANDSFEFDYTPGYTKPTHEFGQPFGDEFHAEAVEELLLSMAGYTQRGVTLAGGNGVLPTGTVLGKVTASGKYVPYTAAATFGAGSNTALGVLRDGRDTGGTSSPAGKPSTDCQGNIVIRGILNANLVSGGDTTGLVSGTGGGVGSATLTALGARILQLGGAITPATAPFPGGPMDGQFTATAGVQITGVNAFIF